MGNLKQAERAPEQAIRYRIEILLTAIAFEVASQIQSQRQAGLSRWIL